MEAARNPTVGYTIMNDILGLHSVPEDNHPRISIASFLRGVWKTSVAAGECKWLGETRIGRARGDACSGTGGEVRGVGVDMRLAVNAEV